MHGGMCIVRIQTGMHICPVVMTFQLCGRTVRRKLTLLIFIGEMANLISNPVVSGPWINIFLHTDAFSPSATHSSAFFFIQLN